MIRTFIFFYISRGVARLEGDPYVSQKITSAAQIALHILFEWNAIIKQLQQQYQPLSDQDGIVFVS